MYNLQDIAARIKAGKQVTDQERAYFITHDPFAFFAFLIDNNPASVNLSLRQMGYNHLGFNPDKKALSAQVEILINQKDVNALHAITKNFLVTESGLTPDFLKAFLANINTVTA